MVLLEVISVVTGIASLALGYLAFRRKSCPRDD